MSHVYRALRQAEIEINAESRSDGSGILPPQLLEDPDRVDTWCERVRSVKPLMLAEQRVVTISERHGLGAEKFRVLRARLRHLQDNKELKKLVITSGVPGEGKSTVASNLAVSLSRHSSQRVLLLEGDLRHPTLAQRFGLASLSGISDWFDTEDPITRFVVRIEGLQLWFLPAGNSVSDPLSILQSNRFADALAQLGSSFDWLIIDGTPLTPLADVHYWAANADGVLLVVRQGKAPKKSLVKGLNNLDGAKLVGVVLNEVQNTDRSYYENYYQAGNGRTNGNGAHTAQNPGQK